jgi:hypothetical protein
VVAAWFTVGGTLCSAAAAAAAGGATVGWRCDKAANTWADK